MRENRLERGDLSPQLRVARLRLLGDALEPLYDVIAVCDQQLEPKRRQVVVRIPHAGPGVQDDE